jgi:NCS1 family nucleobase:cation symporter-1
VNLENLYGAFLTFFTSLSPSGKVSQGWRGRLITTTVVAAIGSVISILASAHFLTDLTNFILFLLYFLIPWTAINFTDYYVIHRGCYDVRGFFKTNGRWGRANWGAIAIFAVTVGIEVPFMDTTWYEGPISKALAGADFAWIIGFLFAATAYYLLTRFTKRYDLVKEELAEIEASGSGRTIPV